MSESQSKQEVHLLWVGLLIEGGMFSLALMVGALGFFAESQPLYAIDQKMVLEALIWGILASIPLLLLLFLSEYFQPRFLRPMKEFIDTKMKPMFASATVFELAILSLMAGIGEEILFRWCIQGGITSLLASNLGEPTSMWIGLAVASWLFGLCHWINATYGLTTLVIGAFLGLTMVYFDNWLVPAVAHALFDFIALLYIARSKPVDYTQERLEEKA